MSAAARRFALVAVVATAAAPTGQAHATVAAPDRAAPSHAAAWDPLPQIEDALSALIRIFGRPGTKVVITRSLDTTVEALRRGSSVSDVRGSLRELFLSDDIYRRALAAGICSGMTQVAADPNAKPSYQSWRRFLLQTVENYVIGRIAYSYTQIKKTVDGLMNAWAIAQVSPQGARVYWRACHP